MGQRVEHVVGGTEQLCGRATSRAEALAELCDRFRVSILYAFGSQAGAVREWLTGNRSGLAAGPADVDVGVKVSRETRLSVREKVRLALAMEDLLDVTRVDLVCLDDADPFLAANVIRGEQSVRPRYLRGRRV